ncbi:helix-hairpin-helix domain-containing protein [Gracilibacillus xinjiangensis]|uniref:Helix-hairpin-helix domain-containing protein n=1 Tax=Gracilibacillus xinjiangensis TaxID=1193282 RepID=A0ABV8X1J2_9BACI
MTLLRKYWYIAIFGMVILIWVLINPSVTKNSSTEQKNIAFDQSQETEAFRKLEEEESITAMVDIKGEVVYPGVYEVDNDDRVKDVIKKAGGVTDNAVMESVNMAERVYDEMVIIVTADSNDPLNSNETKTSDGRVKINHADKGDLMTISGIGEVKANAIIEHRDLYGKFKSLEDLSEVSGIGEKTIEKIEEYIQVP